MEGGPADWHSAVAHTGCAWQDHSVPSWTPPISYLLSDPFPRDRRIICESLTLASFCVSELAPEKTSRRPVWSASAQGSADGSLPGPSPPCFSVSFLLTREVTALWRPCLPLHQLPLAAGGSMLGRRLPGTSLAEM